MWIEVAGAQGHVAYPHLADNPIPRLVRILAAIDAIELDDGTDWFQPSNIEITDRRCRQSGDQCDPAPRPRRACRSASTTCRAARTWCDADRARSSRPSGGTLHRAHFGRSVPDPAGRIQRARIRGDRGGDRHHARTVDHRRHVGRALPVATCARWSNSGCATRRCTSSTRRWRWPISRRWCGSTAASSPPPPEDHVERARAAMADMRAADGGDVAGEGREREPVLDRRGE